MEIISKVTVTKDSPKKERVSTSGQKVTLTKESSSQILLLAGENTKMLLESRGKDISSEDTD